MHLNNNCWWWPLISSFVHVHILLTSGKNPWNAGCNVKWQKLLFEPPLLGGRLLNYMILDLVWGTSFDSLISLKSSKAWFTKSVLRSNIPVKYMRKRNTLIIVHLYVCENYKCYYEKGAYIPCKNISNILYGCLNSMQPTKI